MPETDDEPEHLPRGHSVPSGYEVIVGGDALARALRIFQLESGFLSREQIEALIHASEERGKQGVQQRWLNIGLKVARDAYNPGDNEDAFADLIVLMRRMTADPKEFEVTWLWCRQQATRAQQAKSGRLLIWGLAAGFISALTGFVSMLLSFLGKHL